MGVSDDSCTEGCDTLCVTLISVFSVLLVLVVALTIILCKNKNLANHLSCTKKHTANVKNSTTVHSDKHQGSHDSTDDNKNNIFSVKNDHTYVNATTGLD